MVHNSRKKPKGVTVHSDPPEGPSRGEGWCGVKLAAYAGRAGAGGAVVTRPDGSRLDPGPSLDGAIAFSHRLRMGIPRERPRATGAGADPGCHGLGADGAGAVPTAQGGHGLAVAHGRGLDASRPAAPGVDRGGRMNGPRSSPPESVTLRDSSDRRSRTPKAGDWAGHRRYERATQALRASARAHGRSPDGAGRRTVRAAPPDPGGAGRWPIAASGGQDAGDEL